MEKKGKFILTYIIIFIVIICIAAIAITFAWFSIKNSGSINAFTRITTGKLNVKYVDSSTISITKGTPILDSNVFSDAYKNEFTISHDEDSTINACYNISLDITKLDDRFKSQFFKWSLYDDTLYDDVANGDFENFEAGDEIILTQNKFLRLGRNHSYTLRIWLEYSDDVDQSSMLTGNTSSVFEGNIKVVSKNQGLCGN